MTTILEDCAELKNFAKIMAENNIEREEYVKKVDAWFEDIFKEGRERRARTNESALRAANTELWRQIEEHKQGGCE